jgi:hypothetical protein
MAIKFMNSDGENGSKVGFADLESGDIDVSHTPFTLPHSIYRHYSIPVSLLPSLPSSRN